MTPVCIIIVILISLLILAVKKEHIIALLVIGMCFVPTDQCLIIGSFHLYGLQIFVLAAILKLFDNNQFTWNKIDYIFFSWQIIAAIIYISHSSSPVGALKWKLGRMFMGVGLYWTFRNIIQSKESITFALKMFALCCIILVPFSAVEWFTAKNPFVILGRAAISIRDGRVRSAATFGHAILLGSFATALVPIFWSRVKSNSGNKYIWLFAFLGSIFLIISSASSGPLLTLIVVTLFLMAYKYKYYGKKYMWALIISSLLLHFYMLMANGRPIWHIFARIGVISGSTGYHRYLLIEAAVRELPQWALLGYGDIGPAWHIKYWPWAHAAFTDVTNHYLLEGVRGGLTAMFLFIYLCYHTIATFGRMSIKSKSRNDSWLFWGFAISMVSHCVSFFSVAYFGQIMMLLYFTFAIAAAVYPQSQLCPRKSQQNAI